MKTIGITGNIGSGKSAVTKYISKHWNIPEIDVDELAKKVLERNTDDLVKFGKDIVVDGKINYDHLFQQVFHDPQKIRRYNRWIHPLVIAEIEKELKNIGSDPVIINAPLIFETRFFTDYIILIQCRQNIRMERIFTRNRRKNSLSATAKICRRAMELNNLQFPEEIIALYCDYAIDNDGRFTDTIVQIDRMMEEILQRLKGEVK